MCLINTHILMCQHTRNDTASYGMPLDYITFFANYAQNRRIFMFEVYWKFTINTSCIWFLININIWIYWHARCDCKLWNAPWFYCVFWVFSNFHTSLLSEVLYFHHIFTDCVSNQNTHFDMLTCQMYLQVTASSLVFIDSLEIFTFDTIFFIKLSYFLWKVNGNNFNVAFCRM